MRRPSAGWNKVDRRGPDWVVIDPMTRKEEKLFASEFDERTAANMEVALERICQRLPADKQNHEVRKFIAERIIGAARKGHTNLTELTAAGSQALHQLP